MSESSVHLPLEQLDRERWGEPGEGATSVERDAHRLRKIPIGKLEPGDLRFLLGQRIGVAWLVPVALDRLADDPLVGDYYPGDLLNAVLGIDDAYWGAHPDQTLALWNVRQSLVDLEQTAAKLLARDDWPAFG